MTADLTAVPDPVEIPHASILQVIRVEWELPDKTHHVAFYTLEGEPFSVNTVTPPEVAA